MTQFMDVHHNMVGITAEQLKEAHEADVEHQSAEGVTFLSAWADPKEGVVYCLSEGPSSDAVRRVHERTGHPADEIHEITLAV